MTDANEPADRPDALKFAASRGITLDRDAAYERINRIVWSHIYGLSGEQLGIAEVASRAEMDPDMARRFLRSLGFGTDTGWTEREVDTLTFVGGAAAVLGDESVVHLARVVGTSVARIAEAIADSIRIDYELPTRGASGYFEYLEGVEFMANEWLPQLARVFDHTLRRYLLDIVDNDWRADDEGSAVSVPYAIGFADMVGFTSRVADAGERGLVDLIDRFEGQVSETITGAGGRVVKFIGDEVMFAFRDVDACLRCAQQLHGLASDQSISSVRIGLAVGLVVSRYGDLYGPVVNLASRLVGVAPPGTTYVTSEIADAAGSGFAFDRLGPATLKGIDRPVEHAALR